MSISYQEIILFTRQSHIVQTFPSGTFALTFLPCSQHYQRTGPVEIYRNDTLVYKEAGNNKKNMVVLKEFPGKYSVFGQMPESGSWSFQIIVNPELTADTVRDISANPLLVDDLPEWCLTIAPSPVQEKIRISVSADELLEITLFNLSGQVEFYKAPLRSSDFEIGVSDLPRGLYFVHVRTWMGHERRRRIQLIDP